MITKEGHNRRLQLRISWRLLEIRKLFFSRRHRKFRKCNFKKKILTESLKIWKVGLIHKGRKFTGFHELAGRMQVYQRFRLKIIVEKYCATHEFYSKKVIRTSRGTECKVGFKLW